MGFVVTRNDLNSSVMTPIELAGKLVEHFKPSGRILEPCRGDGGFYDVLPSGTLWCEISKGRDFFDFKEHVDWIITNPPWNKLTDFLEHSLVIADNVCFIIVLQQIWTKKRLKMLKQHGFGIKEICYFDSPPNFPQLGIQIGMIHIQKGWTGDIKLSQLSEPKYSQKNV